jgi:hypothetical protein
MIELHHVLLMIGLAAVVIIPIWLYEKRYSDLV